jgi:hypothetical protein
MAVQAAVAGGQTQPDLGCEYTHRVTVHEGHGCYSMTPWRGFACYRQEPNFALSVFVTIQVK